MQDTGRNFEFFTSSLGCTEQCGFRRNFRSRPAQRSSRLSRLIFCLPQVFPTEVFIVIDELPESANVNPCHENIQRRSFQNRGFCQRSLPCLMDTHSCGIDQQSSADSAKLPQDVHDLQLLRRTEHLEEAKENHNAYIAFNSTCPGLTGNVLDNWREFYTDKDGSDSLPFI